MLGKLLSKAIPPWVKWAAVGLLVALIGAAYARYEYVVSDRARLKQENATLRTNQMLLEQQVESEREAAATAINERAEIARRLHELQRGREQDPEAQEWAATPTPSGEQGRWCALLPELRGCP